MEARKQEIERLNVEVERGRLVVSTNVRRKNIQKAFYSLAGAGAVFSVVALLYFSYVMVSVVDLASECRRAVWNDRMSRLGSHLVLWHWMVLVSVC